jgi:ribosomal-protein-alanine N-acetyltransferase
MHYGLSIREFKSQDARDIVRLHKEFEIFFEEMNISEEFILNISRRPDFRFLIAELNGEVVGFIGALFYTHVARAEVGPIAVDKRYRNIGIGTKLLEKILGFLGDKKIHRVISKAKAGNQRAMDFFLHNGFTKEGYFREYTKQREDVVQYVRFI